ncbi:MAG: RraA family protein [Methanobacterium sp.]|nr:RraA family protein [Methanobacterium sp.]
MKYGRKLSPESLLDKFSPKFSYSKLIRSNLTSSQISDALKNVTGNSGVMKDIKPLLGNMVIGSAVTVKTDADDWGTCVKAIDVAKKGEILVIKVEGQDQAVWGELTSKTAREKGIICTIIDGAVRDIGAIKELRYPVFSKNVVPNAGSPKAQGKINITIECGDVTVNPGDIIAGDECGVVVIAKENLNDVIEEALNIKKKENEIIRRIEKGDSLSSILGLK